MSSAGNERRYERLMAGASRRSMRGLSRLFYVAVGAAGLVVLLAECTDSDKPSQSLGSFKDQQSKIVLVPRVAMAIAATPPQISAPAVQARAPESAGDANLWLNYACDCRDRLDSRSQHCGWHAAIPMSRGRAPTCATSLTGRA
jgi:hypothetical protein